MIMQFGVSLHLLLCLILVIPSLSYAEMYKWIDDQGRVHYGDKPKGKTTAIPVKPIQKHQSKPFKSTNTTKSKSKKATKTTGLTNEQWFHENLEKVGSMSDEDMMQYHAELLRKEEEIKHGILLQMDENEARWKEQAKERQRKFDELKKEHAEAKRRLDDDLASRQAESRKFFEMSDDERKRNRVYKSNGAHTGKYYVKDNILIDSTGKQAGYHSEYYDGNGNPINASGNFVDSKGKAISLPRYERDRGEILAKENEIYERQNRKY